MSAFFRAPFSGTGTRGLEMPTVTLVGACVVDAGIVIVSDGLGIDKCRITGAEVKNPKAIIKTRDVATYAVGFSGRADHAENLINSARSYSGITGLDVEADFNALIPLFSREMPKFADNGAKWASTPSLIKENSTHLLICGYASSGEGKCILCPSDNGFYRNHSRDTDFDFIGKNQGFVAQARAQYRSSKPTSLISAAALLYCVIDKTIKSGALDVGEPIDVFSLERGKVLHQFDATETSAVKNEAAKLFRGTP